MLEHLKLRHVGPSPELEVELTPRLNFFTGDNGLGKSFLLEIAWWALTRTWAQSPAVPPTGTSQTPSIGYRYTAPAGPFGFTSSFDRRRQTWQIPDGESQEAVPGVVIYARADGGFSVWDPARNHWGTTSTGGPSRPPAFLFGPAEVWDGLPRDASKKLCNGLIHDWTSWQREKNEAFKQLKGVLRRLSPSAAELLIPGKPRRVLLDDVRDHPTLKMPYGEEVPLMHASAGMRRIVALSYLLVWTWQEHLRASTIIGSKPARQIIFLVDEIEAHLHPQWQRRAVPALLEVMGELGGRHPISVQFVAATHSPLVLVSVEPHFDENKDAIWELGLEGGEVKLSRSMWRRHGDVNSWLSSSVFELGEPRSLEAEEAMRKALELLRRRPRPTVKDIAPVDEELRRVLSDVDRFWVRWSSFVDDVRSAS